MELLNFMHEREKRDRLARMQAALTNAADAVANLKFNAEAMFVVVKNSSANGEPNYQFASQGFTVEELGTVFAEVKPKLTPA